MCRIASPAAAAKSTAGSGVRAGNGLDKAAATGGRRAVAPEMFASTPVTCQRRQASGVVGGGSCGGGGHRGNGERCR